MTALIPHLDAGTPLLEIQDQPGECGYGCPCNVGESDVSEYGMHWTVAS